MEKFKPVNFEFIEFENRQNKNIGCIFVEISATKIRFSRDKPENVQHNSHLQVQNYQIKP